MTPGEYTDALIVLVGGFFFLVIILAISQLTGE
jgi:hypothetical protein